MRHKIHLSQEAIVADNEMLSRTYDKVHYRSFKSLRSHLTWLCQLQLSYKLQFSYKLQVTSYQKAGGKRLVALDERADGREVNLRLVTRHS